MITTVTANPSVDRTVNIDRWDRGAVIRATQASSEAGGKGINISLALVAAGLPSRAVFPQGGTEGREIADQVTAAGVEAVPVPITGRTRTNVSVVEADGSVTKLNEPGPTLTSADVDELVDAAVSAATGATWLVTSGSLPPGAPDDLYTRIIRAVGGTNVRVAVDTSGEPLASVLEAGPALLKPNHIELGDLVGRRLQTIGETLEAARLLLGRGVEQILVSLGADGALLVSGETEVYGQADPPVVRNTVGAGDALLAGYLAGGASGSESLSTAFGWACAAVRSEQTAMERPTDDDFAAVQIHDVIPSERKLRE